MKRRTYRIKELAENRGMTQEALYLAIRAIGADVSIATIQRLWQNHKTLGDQRVSTMSAIARALGVTIEDLYEDSATGKSDLDIDDRSGVELTSIETPMSVAA